MTSALHPSSTKPSANAVPPQSTSTKSSPVPAVPAQLPKASSYANATKPSNAATPSHFNIATSNSSSATTGAQAPVQHGKLDTHSSTPSMSAPSPSISNPQGDFPRTDSHGRKPSVVISAQGASGQIPNGGPVVQNSRPNIAFGSMVNNQNSPAVAHSGSYNDQQGSSLNTPKHDPRVTSPAHSPSPIPQPPASGGKPPSGLPGQGNGLVFGSSGMENGDANVSG